MRVQPTKGAFPKSHHAFGVDPTRRHFYSLRQSRYDALAQDINDWAGVAKAAGRKLSVLDVACGTGICMRHLEFRPNFDNLLIAATDLVERRLYRPELYREIILGDLMSGYPQIPSNSYDVVICEQLLEHLPRLDTAIATLERVLAPGGRLIVGVPIFVRPLAAIRKHLVPTIDRIFLPRKSRGHLQAFSLPSFLAEMRRHSTLNVLDVRGFRVMSGGPFRPLENYRWWWKCNRWIGELVPWACIEIQAIMEKPPENGSAASCRTEQPDRKRMAPVPRSPFGAPAPGRDAAHRIVPDGAHRRARRAREPGWKTQFLEQQGCGAPIGDRSRGADQAKRDQPDQEAPAAQSQVTIGEYVVEEIVADHRDDDRDRLRQLELDREALAR